MGVLAKEATTSGQKERTQTQDAAVSRVRHSGRRIFILFVVFGIFIAGFRGEESTSCFDAGKQARSARRSSADPKGRTYGGIEESAETSQCEAQGNAEGGKIEKYQSTEGQEVGNLQGRYGQTPATRAGEIRSGAEGALRSNFAGTDRSGQDRTRRSRRGATRGLRSIAREPWRSRAQAPIDECSAGEHAAEARDGEASVATAYVHAKPNGHPGTRREDGSPNFAPGQQDAEEHGQGQREKGPEGPYGSSGKTIREGQYEREKPSKGVTGIQSRWHVRKDSHRGKDVNMNCSWNGVPSATLGKVLSSRMTPVSQQTRLRRSTAQFEPFSGFLPQRWDSEPDEQNTVVRGTGLQHLTLHDSDNQCSTIPLLICHKEVKSENQNNAHTRDHYDLERIGSTMSWRFLLLLSVNLRWLVGGVALIIAAYLVQMLFSWRTQPRICPARFCGKRRHGPITTRRGKNCVTTYFLLCIVATSGVTATAAQMKQEVAQLENSDIIFEGQRQVCLPTLAEISELCVHPHDVLQWLANMTYVNVNEYFWDHRLTSFGLQTSNCYYPIGNGTDHPIQEKEACEKGDGIQSHHGEVGDDGPFCGSSMNRAEIEDVMSLMHMPRPDASPSRSRSPSRHRRDEGSSEEAASSSHSGSEETTESQSESLLVFGKEIESVLIPIEPHIRPDIFRVLVAQHFDLIPGSPEWNMMSLHLIRAKPTDVSDYIVPTIVLFRGQHSLYNSVVLIDIDLYTNRPSMCAGDESDSHFSRDTWSVPQQLTRNAFLRWLGVHELCRDHEQNPCLVHYGHKPWPQQDPHSYPVYDGHYLKVVIKVPIMDFPLNKILEYARDDIPLSRMTDHWKQELLQSRNQISDTFHTDDETLLGSAIQAQDQTEVDDLTSLMVTEQQTSGQVETMHQPAMIFVWSRIYVPQSFHVDPSITTSHHRSVIGELMDIPENTRAWDNYLIFRVLPAPPEIDVFHQDPYILVMPDEIVADNSFVLVDIIYQLDEEENCLFGDETARDVYRVQMRASRIAFLRSLKVHELCIISGRDKCTVIVANQIWHDGDPTVHHLHDGTYATVTVPIEFTEIPLSQQREAARQGHTAQWMARMWTNLPAINLLQNDVTISRTDQTAAGQSFFQQQLPRDLLNFSPDGLYVDLTERHNHEHDRDLIHQGRIFGPSDIMPYALQQDGVHQKPTVKPTIPEVIDGLSAERTTDADPLMEKITHAGGEIKDTDNVILMQTSYHIPDQNVCPSHPDTRITWDRLEVLRRSGAWEYLGTNMDGVSHFTSFSEAHQCAEP